MPGNLPLSSRKLYRLLLILAAVSLSLLGAGRAAAQANMEFSTFEVDLWPEYDRPEMLVIYKGTLATELTMPVEISLRIPAAAGQPYNLAYQEMDGQLYNIAYDTRLEGSWLRVTFTTPSPTFQLEYYDPALSRIGDERSYQFSWPADYTVQALNLQVQQPVNAEPVHFVPDMGTPVAGANGLLYSMKEVGEVRQGTQFNLSLSYAKPDDVLTSAGLQPVEPSAPIESGTPESGLLGALPLIFAGAGLLLLAAGLLWMFLRRAPAPEAKRQRNRSRARLAAEADDISGGNIYCHSCGKRAAPGDSYCRTCGTRLKIGSNS